MKRVIRLTESDLVSIVKRVINEQENDISTIDRTQDIPEVKVNFFKVNPNALYNVEKVNAVIYDSETGNVLGRPKGATTNVVLTKTEPNLSNDKFKKWLSTDPVLSQQKIFKLKMNTPYNLNNMPYVKYEKETGNVLGPSNEKVASTQSNLTDEQFIEWLKRNKLTKRKQ